MCVCMCRGGGGGGEGRGVVFLKKLFCLLFLMFFRFFL